MGGGSLVRLIFGEVDLGEVGWLPLERFIYTIRISTIFLKNNNIKQNKEKIKSDQI